jgi:hypothetical protein
VSGSRSDLNRRYLVVMTLSGATREYLIPPNAYQSLYGPGSIRWFGNGRGLGFAGSDAKGQDVMFRLSLPSGEWTTIPRRGSSVGTAIEWNDDGTEFYFARQGNAERNGIVRKNVDNGSEELLYELTTREAFVMDLEISPDRRRLAFQTVRDSVKGSPVIVLSWIRRTADRGVADGGIRGYGFTEVVRLVSRRPCSRATSPLGSRIGQMVVRAARRWRPAASVD